MTDLVSVASALFMHTGSRHMAFDLTDAQKRLINKPGAKLIIMFSLFYMSTRSLVWSSVLVATYFLAVNMLLNEHHPLHILPASWLKSEGFVTGDKDADAADAHDASNKANLYYANLKRLP